MSCVYFILDEKSNAVKIGKSNNIKERLLDLQTGNPNTLKVLRYVKCKSEESSFHLEKQYHKKFEHLHMIGEWFNYDKCVFDKLFTENFVNVDNDNIEFKVTEKRNPLKMNTLFGEEEVFGMRNSPNCYFYPNLIAQIMDNFEDSLKLKTPFRTMEYPTHGKSLILPYDNKKDRVFISHKKHLENIEFNMHKNIKTNSLESFFE